MNPETFRRGVGHELSVSGPYNLAHDISLISISSILFPEVVGRMPHRTRDTAVDAI